MSTSNLQSGTCPRCNYTEIYTTRGIPKQGERGTLAVSAWKFLFLDVYICLQCGHFEEYIAEKEFKDPKVIDKIKSTWKKVNSSV